MSCIKLDFGKHWKDIIVVIAMLLLPIGLILLPKNQLDNGPTLCVYTLVTGSNCWGCGMTRAFMRLLHGDIAGAMAFNKLSLLVFPIFTVVYLRILYAKISKIFK